MSWQKQNVDFSKRYKYLESVRDYYYLTCDPHDSDQALPSLASAQINSAKFSSKIF